METTQQATSKKDDNRQAEQAPTAEHQQQPYQMTDEEYALISASIEKAFQL